MEPILSIVIANPRVCDHDVPPERPLLSQLTGVAIVINTSSCTRLSYFQKSRRGVWNSFKIQFIQTNYVTPTKFDVSDLMAQSKFLYEVITQKCGLHFLTSYLLDSHQGAQNAHGSLEN